MWNANTGNNYTRLLDQNNSMKRHYRKLKEIQKRSKKSKFVNERYEKFKMKPKRHTKVKMNRANQIRTDNVKILNAIEKISKRWGDFGPNNFKDQETIKQKTLGFKKKTNQDMIKENLRYMEKMNAVKPVYNKKMFENEERNYLYLKKNIKVSNGNYRKMKTKSFCVNDKQVKKIKRRRPKSAGFKLRSNDMVERSVKGSRMKKSRSVLRMNNNKVLYMSEIKPNMKFYGLGLNRRPRSALFKKDGRVKRPKFKANSASVMIID